MCLPIYNPVIIIPVINWDLLLITGLQLVLTGTTKNPSTFRTGVE